MSERGQGRPIRISVEEAKQRYDDNEVTILDVVDPPAHGQLDHQIEGAVRIDPREIQDEFDRVPKDRAVLTY